LNLTIVMGLGGLWHGAGLSYLLWGLLHATFLVVERPILPYLKRIDSLSRRIFQRCLVFLCISMLWIFFKLPNSDHAIAYLYGMFTPSTNPNPTKIFYNLALLYALPVLIQHLVPTTWLDAARFRRMEPYLYGAMAAWMFLEAGPETAFIYFQF
jgi:alginate O-acetyltransferase complex protein AlgI